ncbi:MAG: tRNA (guanine(10)-N(2))-dimethyltransferase [Candidatus Bathyarchaeota archaeon]|jgi:tRNA (guanine26-N2/guanine27-N2)-dimethyltransferase
MEYPTVSVEEGQASILVPEVVPGEGEPLQRARSRAPVFFNPTMKLNRDSAVLALGTFQKVLSRDLCVCEPMCGTGVRGIRLALETDGVDRVVLGDLNPRAVNLAKENARRNGVVGRVDVRCLEANLLLSLHARPFSRFDYVDIDPYGTPAPFIDSAIRASKRDGMVALTATDMAPLCGVNPRVCLRKYGGWPLKTDDAHESALRILAGAFVRRAAVHEVSTEPVFSFASDHYIRLYMLMDRGKRKADGALKQIGHIFHCPQCLSRRTVRGIRPSLKVCEVCGASMRAAGPMWLGDLADPSFCAGMIKLSETSFIGSNRRLMRIIERMKREVGLPSGFYNLDKIGSMLGVPSTPMDPVLRRLIEAGFKAVVSHVDERGVKTDAPIKELERIVLGLQ